MYLVNKKNKNKKKHKNGISSLGIRIINVRLIFGKRYGGFLPYCEFLTPAVLSLRAILLSRYLEH